VKIALAVIDVQSYFTRKSPAGLPARIAHHIKKSNYDLLAFTVFQNSDGSNWETSLHWSKCKTKEDIELAAELKPFATQDNTFIKASYSAFKNDSFKELLKEKGISRLEICGIDTDACVLATAFDAFDYGYEVKVLFDLSYSSDGLDEPTKKIITRNMQSKN
jgi:nicotinamidase-related amidase